MTHPQARNNKYKHNQYGQLKEKKDIIFGLANAISNP
jgi:hypothetical protein